MFDYFQSLALAELKKLNAAKLEEKRRTEMQAAGIDSGPPKPQVLLGTRFRTCKTPGNRMDQIQDLQNPRYFHGLDSGPPKSQVLSWTRFRTSKIPGTFSDQILDLQNHRYFHGLDSGPPKSQVLSWTRFRTSKIPDTFMDQIQDLQNPRYFYGLDSGPPNPRYFHGQEPGTRGVYFLKKLFPSFNQFFPQMLFKFLVFFAELRKINDFLGKTKSKKVFFPFPRGGGVI